MIETAGKTWAERAAIIPGGSLTRSKKVFGRWAEQAAGAIIVDVDGNALIDMVCGLGAVALGYREPLHQGMVYSLPHAFEVVAAETVLQHVAPWASHVRFVKTGSEATTAAYRIAKKATGRSVVLRGDWAYHGWHEWTDKPEWTFTHGADVASLGFEERIVAAVLIEPHRWEPVNVEWLKSVRAFCDRVGALLIFDEMIYGGRWALGGATEYFGVVPDMGCYGKAFGNGQAVAFVAGREALAEHGEMISGTFSGDTVGLSSVVEVVGEYLSRDVIGTLWNRGRQLARGLDYVFSQYPALGAVREGQPVHQRIRFAPPYHGGTLFSNLMAERGVLWHPDCVNVMAAHTPGQIEQVIDTADDCCRVLSKGL